MSSILVATARDALRAEIAVPLAREGIAVRPVSDWAATCRALATPTTRLLLVDPALPGLDPALLAALAASLPHRPGVRALGADAPPLVRLPATPRAALRVARDAVGAGAVDPTDKRLLRLAGLGPAPLELLARLAASPLPVLLHGERGTGKVRVARILHQVGGGGRFVEGTAVPEGPPGTLYVKEVHGLPGAADVVRRAQEAGWRVVAGSRLAEPVAGVGWTRLSLPPLRERPADLRALAEHYLEVHARRMGLPKRRFDRGMWALVLAWTWPGNARELEAFVVQVLGNVDQPTIRGATLPAELRALLVARVEPGGEVEGFEEMARARLAPVVSAYQPAAGAPTLHELVVGSAERALIQLVLARTQGSRKAAAALLGLARNTLQARIERLAVDAARD